MYIYKIYKYISIAVAQDRLLLNGKNTPLPPLPPPKCIAYTSGEFPPPDAPWWKEAQQLVQPQVTVLRDGEFSKIPAEDIVTGDILYINGGDKIHADIRVIVADQCVAESYLGLESRQYNLLEYCDNSDPLYIIILYSILFLISYILYLYSLFSVFLFLYFILLCLD